jgi:hypothetical protein
VRWWRTTKIERWIVRRRGELFQLSSEPAIHNVLAAREYQYSEAG